MYNALIDLIGSFPGDKIAIAQPESDLGLTYESLRDQARVMARALTEAGVERGDRIAIALPNGPVLVTALLAASTIGAAMPLPANRDGRFDSSLDTTGARAVIDADGLHMTPTTRKGSGPGSDPLVAVILQTRGRSGRPRRVPLSHTSVAMAATYVASALALGPDDVSLCVTPIAHVDGLVATTLATLASGGTVVIPAAFHPVSFWRVARDHRVTWYTAAPTQQQWLLARTAAPGARRPSGAARLRFIRSSGAALPSAIHQTLESAFGVPVLDAYVVTEACGQAALQLPSSPRGKLRPHDGVSVAILDPGGRTVEAGAMGEVALAGPTVALGYDGDPEATRKFFIGGWFRTGDFGYLDADGCLTLAGTTENTEPPNDCR